MLVMFDSIDVKQIPNSAPAVAGYVGGRWPTFAELEREFPHSRRLSVAVNAREDADCLDIERGDASPGEAPGWLARQLHRGVWRPCLYFSISDKPEVVGDLAKAGFHRSTYRIWSAHYTGTPHIEEGSDATQWTDRALGRDLDESLCLPTFFRPLAPPPPARPRRPRAQLEFDPASGGWSIHGIPAAT